jgi:hypothetical protein
MRAVVMWLALGVAVSAWAGDVKIKKGLVSIGEQPVFQYEGAMRIEGSTAMVHSAVSKAPLFTIHYVAYVSGVFHFNLKYVGLEGEARRYSAMSFKDLFDKIYKAGAVTPEGALDLEKAAEFHRMFGRPIPEGRLLLVF